ncbi:MAG: hypothetical protein LH606_05625 [Cytophagaceae bacterium]|nr:hypothetical protein [Cytophagaceae bacterium]
MASENSAFKSEFWKMVFGILGAVILAFLGLKNIDSKPPSPAPVQPVYDQGPTTYKPAVQVVQTTESEPISLVRTWYDEENTPTVLTEADANVTLSMNGFTNGVAVEITGTGTRYRQTVPMTLSVTMMGIQVGTMPGKFILEDESHAALTYQLNGINMSSTLRR